MLFTFFYWGEFKASEDACFRCLVVSDLWIEKAKTMLSTLAKQDILLFHQWPKVDHWTCKTLIKKYRIKFLRYSCRLWSTYFCSYLLHPFVRKRLLSVSRFLFQSLPLRIKLFSHNLNFPRKRIWGLSDLFLLSRVLHDKL